FHTLPKCHQAFIDACNYEDIGVLIPPLDCVTRDCLFSDPPFENE
ncbi:18496_t:CDS:2, partial [Gigaspora margarita]